MAKNKTVAYILWFFGGFFGLHHFYLGRDRQAFVWWAFFGGYVGCGWIRDLWKISSYVEEANESQKYLEKLTHIMVRQKTPDVGWVRFSGMLMVGNTFGYLAISAIPMEYVPASIYSLFYVLIPAGCAFGKYCFNVRVLNNLLWGISYFTVQNKIFKLEPMQYGQTKAKFGLLFLTNLGEILAHCQSWCR